MYKFYIIIWRDKENVTYKYVYIIQVKKKEATPNI